MCFNETVDWVAPIGSPTKGQIKPQSFQVGHECSVSDVLIDERPLVADCRAAHAKGLAPLKSFGVFLLADRTPHVSRGQYSGPLGVKRTRLNNNPAQPDLLKVLARTAEIGNGRLANDTGLLEEELSHFVRGSQVSALYVPDGLKLGSFLAWVVLSPKYRESHNKERIESERR